MTASRNAGTRRLLITSGPTWEPIDQVRYIGNRSSGKLGAALADAAAARGWEVLVLLGPQAAEPTDTSVRSERFHTAADLQAALSAHAPQCDALIMAAAVADYRAVDGDTSGKRRRGEGELTLRLEPVPDLIASEAKRKRADQCFVAFALEPRERVLESARAKLERKGLDAIVANPLETMGADTIEAWFLTPAGGQSHTGGPVSKPAFAAWLMERVERCLTPQPASAAGDAEL